MIYDGKKASLEIQMELKNSVEKMTTKPSLAVISIAHHPSITSFIKIKKRFGEAIGVKIDEFNFLESFGEDNLISEIKKISDSKKYNGMIVQLPLPVGYNSEKILNSIPQKLDVDVLGIEAWNTFKNNKFPVPPVAGAVAHILHTTSIDIKTKKVVILGNGKLVGSPVYKWFLHQGVTPTIVDITTSEEIKNKAYKEADIVVSGIGVPHNLKPDYFKNGVVLIDAGTSEQAGVLAGDCDPLCATIASVFTSVPGGVGPLTVAHLFKNILLFTEK